MTCCVPNCDTSYSNKNSKGLTLFTPDTDKRVEEWAEILREKCGLEKFSKKSRICILHFGDDVIEREYNIVQAGKLLKQFRQRPILSPYANPTIFSDNPKKTTRKKNKVDYCVVLDPAIVEQQRKLFKEAVHSVNEENVISVQPKVEDVDIAAVKPVKRKAVDVPLEDEKTNWKKSSSKNT